MFAAFCTDVGGLSLSDELDVLCGAAQRFMTDAGLALGEVPWSRSGPLYKGGMAERLTVLSHTTGKMVDEALLVLVAQGAGPRDLIFGSASPLVVRGDIEGAFAAGGPFEALVHWRLDPMSRLEALVPSSTPCSTIAVSFQSRPTSNGISCGCFLLRRTGSTPMDADARLIAQRRTGWFVL